VGKIKKSANAVKRFRIDKNRDNAFNHTWQYAIIIPLSMVIGCPVLARSVKRAEQKQREIVNAAESLFLQLGYGASSMDQIAELAGVTKQTVYRYFPSKHKLFAAVMGQMQATESQLYCFSDGSVSAELFGYGCYLLHFHLQVKVLGLYRLMLTEGAREDLFKTFSNVGPQRVLKPLIEYLQQYSQVEDPVFAAQMLASMILAPRTQLLMNGSADMKKSDQKAHVQKVTKLFLNMIET
jgi:AcrR family transcriptional regulator